jgi:GMP synthase-like glutamine amidotransferase
MIACPPCGRVAAAAPAVEACSPMRVHWLQHVPFEGLGSMEPWLRARASRLCCSALHRDPRLPPPGDFDALVVMGGPMGVHDEARYAWLAAEKRLVRDAIDAGKVVLGVCLGAQLVAASLGAAVRRNPEREIGWFAVEPAGAAGASAFAALFSRPLEVFHWHGDTFGLPAGAVHLARSEACANQAFAVGERVLGLQFHLETTPESARALIENCRDELTPGRFVQSEREMLASAERFARINRVMEQVLEVLFRSLV